MEETVRAIAGVMRQGGGVALTGAGISAESGISTYRDSGGLWDRYQEGSSQGILGVLLHHPEDAPRILGEFFRGLELSEPNAGHRALAHLERMGILQCVITQNIDDLHRRAGSRHIHELHGNIYRLRCPQCGATRVLSRRALSDLGQDLVRAAAVSLEAMANCLPICTCKDRMRPDFVGFGEKVQHMDQALAAVHSCSWMLIVGTSGLVHPAASLPYIALEHGATIIEVNPRPSSLSDLADIIVRGTAGEVLPLVVQNIF
jgi:NAD-dependent deacetylase